MDSIQTAGGSGVGIGGLTFVVLLILKIIGEIQLSWFLVLTSLLWAPFLAGIAVLVIISTVIGIIAVIIGIAALIQKL